MRILTVLVLIVSAGILSAWASPLEPHVDRRPYDRVWTHRPVRFIGLGDSITSGYNSDRFHSYFNRLVDGAPDEEPDMQGVHLSGVFPALRVENHAAAGSGSYRHVEQARRVRPSGPDTLGWIVITTGANDLIYRYNNGPGDGAMFGATRAAAAPWIAGFGRRLDRIVDELVAKFPGGCHVFIANIYDPTDGVGDLQNTVPEPMRSILGISAWPDGEAILSACNREIARVATRKNVHLVDIHGLFLGHGIHCRDSRSPNYRPADPTFWYTGDVQHPSERGHDAIRREFLQVMAPLEREVRAGG